MGGSSSTETVQRPQYAEDAMRSATQRANMIYEAGRMPFTGIDVVAINPAEQAAIDQAAMAASAFGMPSAAANPFEGMEMLESGGLRGYSSYPIYIADMQRLKEQRPEQYAALARQSGFDPITGEAIAPVYTGGAYYGGGGGGSGGGGSDNQPSFHERMMALPHHQPKFGGFVNSDGFIDAPPPSTGSLAGDLGMAVKKIGGKLFGGFGGK
jgi:hypothetical protein